MLEIATERLVLRPLEIEGKLRTAKGVEQMNAALASVIAGMWLGVECGTLLAEFQLRAAGKRARKSRCVSAGPPARARRGSRRLPGTSNSPWARAPGCRWGR